MTIFKEYNSIPAWIENSDYFNSLDEEELFILDENNIKTYIFPEGTIYDFPDKINKNNIVTVMNTIRYFGIDDREIFYKVFEYIFESRSSHLQYSFPEFKELWENYNYDMKKYKGMDNGENINPMKIEAVRSGRKAHLNRVFAAVACRLNHVYLLMYLHRHGCIIIEHTCNNAIKNNNVECLKYAYPNAIVPWISMINGVIHKKPEDYVEVKFNFSYSSMEIACMYGSLECLQYIQENDKKFSFDGCQKKSSFYGKFEIFKYSLDNCETRNSEIYSNLLKRSMFIKTNVRSEYDKCLEYYNASC